jgi:hypothetical protein
MAFQIQILADVVDRDTSEVLIEDLPYTHNVIDPDNLLDPKLIDRPLLKQMAQVGLITKLSRDMQTDVGLSKKLGTRDWCVHATLQ